MSEIKVNSVVNSTGDNDSGLDLSTNDQVIIKTANTTAVTVDSSQNVGIGTSPSEKLHISGTNTGGFRLTNSDNSDAISLFVRGGNAISSTSDDTVLNVGSRSDNSIITTGNVLVGKSVTNIGTAGIALRGQDDSAYFTRDGGVPIYINRLSSDGEMIQLNQGGSTIGSIVSSQSVTGPFFGHINVGLTMYHVGNAVLPATTGGLRDNAIDLGNSSNRFDDIYATNSTIQTSDRNEKQDIEELSEAERRVAVVAKGLMRKFRWIDSVVEKGDNARTHFGIIAQDLQDAFTAEGLDAGDYAMFTSTTWWEKEISVDAVEADEENGIEAKEAYTYKKIAEEPTEGYTERTRLGVRYNQLLAFIISAL